jgi:hypothetical protein
MNALASLLFGLAVLLVAMTGLTAMFGADKARDALARAAAGVTVAALFLPYAGRVLTGAVGELGSLVSGLLRHGRRQRASRARLSPATPVSAERGRTRSSVRRPSSRTSSALEVVVVSG